jgi:hypothetical protein
MMAWVPPPLYSKTSRVQISASNSCNKHVCLFKPKISQLYDPKKDCIVAAPEYFTSLNTVGKYQ